MLKVLLLISLTNGNIYYNIMDNKQACEELSLKYQLKYKNIAHAECFVVKHINHIGKTK